ncbi:LrgB family protein [Clostridium sp. CS001]|uniref:LrgB family protein n=1 Tax=Clostridium sp. CS001 TaxID=2880648 RepID=UPI001CF47969|nr:LrgB family protein [Clostridium sp. CS001]MCB2288567.1 LrgB family protein [Clostridium sp. CS001]
MKEILRSSVFGVMISLIAFEIGLLINKKTRKSFLNPLLIAMTIVILALKIFDISPQDYNKGGQIISFFLGPATVALAVPLFKNLAVLKKNALPIIVGIFSGSIVSVISTILFSKVFGLTDVLTLSLIPKSVTTPIGIEVSKQIGGVPEITVAAIIVTGITGAIMAQVIFSALKIKDKIAMGIAIGTSAHAVGTSKAIEMGEIEGGMSGLSIGVAGLITVIIAPVIVKIFQYLSVIK